MNILFASTIRSLTKLNSLSHVVLTKKAITVLVKFNSTGHHGHRLSVKSKSNVCKVPILVISCGKLTSMCGQRLVAIQIIIGFSEVNRWTNESHNI